MGTRRRPPSPARVHLRGGRSLRAALGLLVWASGCARARPSPLELWLGGDTHLGARTEKLFDALPRELSGAVGVVNLEGPVTALPERWEGGSRRLANHPRTLAALRSAGVRVAGIANNHALDAGPDGPAGTASALRRAGLLPVGAPSGEAALTLGGRRVVFTAHDLRGGVPPGLARDLTRARSGGDLLVSTFHVTAAPLYLPRPELRQAVEVALRAGAAVVAAHGTHALGPVERRRRAVVAWGLGNLAFACDCTDEREGAVLRVSVDGGATRASVIPVEAGLHGQVARLSPDARGVFDLLSAIGSRGLRVEGARGWF